MIRAPAGRAVVVALAALACADATPPTAQGTVTLVSASSLSGVTLRDRADATAFANRTPALAPGALAVGQPLGFVAIFPRAVGSLQLGLVVYEETDHGRRVVHADQLGVATDARHATGTITPGSAWPRPCRTYELGFSSANGDLASSRVTTAGCPKALEDLRGKAIFHLGKGGPPLFSFEGSLSSYKGLLGVRPVLLAPLQKAPFFLGWKAAFERPAGVASVRVRLAEAGAGTIVDERDLPVDPSWDSLAGGWEIPAAPSWPKAGVTYELTLRTPRSDEPLVDVSTQAVAAPRLPLAPERVLARAGVVVGNKVVGSKSDRPGTFAR